MTQTLQATGQPPSVSTSTEDIDRHAWQAGVAAALGVEWLLARRIGLFAEYGSSLGYSSSEETRRTIMTSTVAGPVNATVEVDTHAWDFFGSGGRLGVSAYF